jgi:hypothetical protein
MMTRSARYPPAPRLRGVLVGGTKNDGALMRSPQGSGRPLYWRARGPRTQVTQK